MKQIKSSLPIILFLALAITSHAQIDTIVRAFVDQAARNQQRQPQQQPVARGEEGGVAGQVHAGTRLV